MTCSTHGCTLPINPSGDVSATSQRKRLLSGWLLCVWQYHITGFSFKGYWEMTMGCRSENAGDDPSQPTLLSVVEAMMGIDPVKLEQPCLVLYGTYIAHLGWGKKATQEATKHVISDLWREAMVWDAMPPLSLVAPTITVNEINHDVTTLQYSVRYLSWAARKSLLA